MRINDFGSVPPVDDTIRTERVQGIETNPSSSSDVTDVSADSADSSDVSTLAHSVLRTLNASDSRLDELKRQFEAGSYNVDSSKIGAKIAESFSDD